MRSFEHYITPPPDRGDQEEAEVFAQRLAEYWRRATFPYTTFWKRLDG